MNNLNYSIHQIQLLIVSTSVALYISIYVSKEFINNFFNDTAKLFMDEKYNTVDQMSKIIKKYVSFVGVSSVFFFIYSVVLGVFQDGIILNSYLLFIFVVNFELINKLTIDRQLISRAIISIKNIEKNKNVESEEILLNDLIELIVTINKNSSILGIYKIYSPIRISLKKTESNINTYQYHISVVLTQLESNNEILQYHTKSISRFEDILCLLCWSIFIYFLYLLFFVFTPLSAF